MALVGHIVCRPLNLAGKRCLSVVLSQRDTAERHLLSAWLTGRHAPAWHGQLNQTYEVYR